MHFSGRRFFEQALFVRIDHDGITLDGLLYLEI